jgi:hypothetical protein
MSQSVTSCTGIDSAAGPALMTGILVIWLIPTQPAASMQMRAICAPRFIMYGPYLSARLMLIAGQGSVGSGCSRMALLLGALLRLCLAPGADCAHGTPAP